MSDYPATKQMEMDKNLIRSIDSASSIITKNYLDKLETYDIIPPSTEDLDIDPKEIGAFYKLTKLVWNKDENFLDKLTTIVDVVYSIRCSLVTMKPVMGRISTTTLGYCPKSIEKRLIRKEGKRIAERFPELYPEI